MLHRPFVPDTRQLDHRKEAASTSFAVCLLAADAILVLIGRYKQLLGGLQRVNSAFIFVLLQAGLIYVAASASRQQHIAVHGVESLRTCIDWLKELKLRTTSMSIERYIAVLQTLAVKLCQTQSTAFEADELRIELQPESDVPTLAVAPTQPQDPKFTDSDENQSGVFSTSLYRRFDDDFLASREFSWPEDFAQWINSSV